MPRLGTSHAWRQRRARWQQRLPVPCFRCGTLIQPWDAWDLDHTTETVLGGTDDQTRPSHTSCNRRAGGELAKELHKLGAHEARRFLSARHAASTTRAAEIPPLSTDLGVNPDDEAEDEAECPGPADPVWDRCPWLTDLRAVPDDGVWPRLMSLPHPDAVGSYGPSAIEWVDRVAGISLRWWQRLAITRALEHDADGALVWLEVDVSTARQVGKSWLIRALATWRIHAADQFGEPQLVLHTGKDLPICKEVMRPARVWARTRLIVDEDGAETKYVVREQNGNEEIGHPDGSRWIVRGKTSVYGYAVSVGLVDEAWDVEAEIVEDGIEPTLGDRTDPQLWLVSTAHRGATSLFPLRRATALAATEHPGSSLLVEWSARRTTGIEDRAAWRQASPHWTPQRERLLDAKLTRVLGGVSEDPDEDDPIESFRSQYLNIWPVRRLVSTHRDEALIVPEEWTAAGDLTASIPTTGPVVVAVEDWFGVGAAACAAAVGPDGRVLVWGEEFADRETAIGWAAFTVEGRDGSAVLTGSSIPIGTVQEAVGFAPLKMTTTDLRAALPLLRVVVRQGRLIHGGSETALTGQVSATRVVPREGGLVIPQRTSRTDLVRALAWAVMGAIDGASAPVPRPGIF